MSQIKFKMNSDLRGKLIAIDSEFDLPFDIKRVFYIKDLDNLDRGFHAHRKCEQILIPISGSFTLTLDNGNSINEYFLDKPNEGIHIPLYNWLSMKEFTQDCIIMVICSYKYDEEEYIRDYNTFLQEVRKNSNPIKKKIYNFSLKEQSKLLKRKILNNIEKIIDSTEFVMGSEVIKFENKFSEYNNVKYCIGVSNGCAALKIALKSLELKNPKVIVQANTYVAVPLICEELKIKYDLIDIDDNLLLDLDKLEEYLKNYKENNELVLMLVHLYGNCVDMNKLLTLKKKYNFKLIEDAAQAHGSTFENKNLGTFGDIGCFSFYPSKNLGTYGEAGAVITNNKQYYEYCRRYRNYGSIRRYKWEILGGNERMDNIHGSILSTKLDYLDEWNNKRIKLAEQYFESLKEDDIKILKPIKGCISNYHLFVILTDKRDELKKYLESKNIFTAIHYPNPFYESDAYKHIDSSQCLNMEKFKYKLLSIPIYPELKKEQIIYISNMINNFS
jgi:dTDP-4-amino-4,6-dideoxygalactose transaminase